MLNAITLCAHLSLLQKLNSNIDVTLTDIYIFKQNLTF